MDIDVTKCDFYDDCECKIYTNEYWEPESKTRDFCRDHDNCYYKQLQRVLQKDNKPMTHVIIEFDIPDRVEAQYRKIYKNFEKKISALDGMTYDSFEVKEFEIDEIPF